MKSSCNRTSERVKRLIKPFLLSITLLTAAVVSSAETWVFIDDLGREVAVPTDPQRIVSLHDIGFTIPLLELGVHPVGSHGRTTADGEPFIRASRGITGIDFDNSSIQFMGNLPADIELVAAVSPDLIITSPWQTASVEQLEQIAPTVVLDNSQRERFEIYELLAEVVGRTDELELLKRRYEGQLAEIRRLIDTENITVNVIQGVNGDVLSWHTYGTLGVVLRDAGFRFPERVDAIPEGDFVRFSAEAFPELDADFLFVTYRTDTLETPADAVSHLEEVAPGFCNFLYACRNGQMVIMPREEASTASYYAKGIMAYTIISHISGREFSVRGDQ